MRKVLEDLYYGNITPNEQRMAPGSELKRAIDRIACYEGQLMEQLYSIPESYQADVKILHLRQENGYLLDLDGLRSLVTPKTKMISINNPNNPTGALMGDDMLKQIAEVADRVGAWVLCDEVYRHLTQEDSWCGSIADLYDKGISVSSMSKVFSLAGLRLGWITARDETVIRACLSHRDYNLISCGIFDEALAAAALRHSQVLLGRNRNIVWENMSILNLWLQNEFHVCYTGPLVGMIALIRLPAIKRKRNGGTYGTDLRRNYEAAYPVRIPANGWKRGHGEDCSGDGYPGS